MIEIEYDRRFDSPDPVLLALAKESEEKAIKEAMTLAPLGSEIQVLTRIYARMYSTEVYHVLSITGPGHFKRVVPVGDSPRDAFMQHLMEVNYPNPTEEL